MTTLRSATYTARTAVGPVKWVLGRGGIDPLQRYAQRPRFGRGKRK